MWQKQNLPHWSNYILPCGQNSTQFGWQNNLGCIDLRQEPMLHLTICMQRRRWRPVTQSFEVFSGESFVQIPLLENNNIRSPPFFFMVATIGNPPIWMSITKSLPARGLPTNVCPVRKLPLERTSPSTTSSVTGSETSLMYQVPDIVFNASS
mmetsp:Transcript_37189/g.67766  ORF Transcript_37189/g.67766 Transcript_37189/m.67766 type:complete len:152 (-) Transcript_37189:43-498(-)